MLEAHIVSIDHFFELFEERCFFLFCHVHRARGRRLHLVGLCRGESSARDPNTATGIVSSHPEQVAFAVPDDWRGELSVVFLGHSVV